MVFRSFLGGRQKPSTCSAHDPQKLGMRSPLVLAKIGSDLRERYDAVLGEPLPEEIQRAADQLPGAPKVLPFPRDPKPEV